TVSSLNVASGVTVANLVTVKVGRDGRVRLRNQSGQVHLIVDLSGYTTSPGASTTGSTYVPRTPVRLLDTRDTAAVGPGQQRLLDVRTTRAGGSSGVPDTATAVVLNVTATAPTGTTDVRVYPTRTGSAPPVVSNLNTTRGRTVPNLVVVAVGELSSVSLRNQAGSVHLIADLAGWYVPGDSGAAFHPVDPVRLVDTRSAGGSRIGPGETLDVRVAGDGVVPASASAVVLNVTAVAPSATSDIRAYPAGPDGPPLASNLNVILGQTVPNAVVVSVGRDGAVRLFNSNGTVDLIVDLAGWYAPTGDGWDISWPQCTSRGSSTSRLPSGGAFAVVGLTRGSPFTDNECFAAQWAWASSLPGEPSVYLNLDAPGARDTQSGRVWAQVCGTGQPTSACATQYGQQVAAYALARLPITPSAGKPMLWMDVEGPYANGPFWQTGYGGAVAINRAVYVGAVLALRDAGYRVGVYGDRKDSTSNDWVNIMGNYRLLLTQNWVFRAADGEGAGPMCAKDVSSTGGPVVMVQVQPGQSGQTYDVNHLC
ncbi:MAG: hypothetical protein H7323_09825, partial [Frankiales bacterium]|nr:hypothetical protein [Frankiales bacterium]